MLREELLVDLAMVRSPFNPPSNVELTHAQETRLMEMWNALVAPATDE